MYRFDKRFENQRAEEATNVPDVKVISFDIFPPFIKCCLWAL